MTHHITRAALGVAGALVAGLAARPAAAQGNSPFEGIVTMQINGDHGTPQTLDYYVRNGAVRIEMQPGGDKPQIAVIMDPKDQLMFMMMPAQQMYMQMPLAKIDARVKSSGGTPEITKTGKMDKIAGYSCEHWIVKSNKDDAAKGDSADVCMSKELGGFWPMQGPGGGQGQPSWLRELGAGGYFPLRVTKIGASTPVIEVTHVEKKSLDASLFQPPADFKKMDMGGMGGGKP